MPVLQFKGKTAVENYHHTVPHHRLEFDKKLSLLEDGEQPSLEGNLIIEGDNLLALKALLPTHAGRVKCIYIDPPYNTGNEGWVYNDNLTQPQFKEWIGRTVGKEGEDACRHDKWCCMMYPRLVLLRELLCEDGIILVSIDDNEVHNLRPIMDEIFGNGPPGDTQSNFMGSVVWKTRNTDNRVKTHLSEDHEYVLVYRKSPQAKWHGRLIDRSDFANPDDDPRGPYVTDPLTGKATAASRPNLHFVIENPETGDKYPPDPSRGWITDPAGVDLMIQEKRVWWPPDPNTGKPRKKRYLSETSERMPESSFWADVRGRSGADEVDQILGRRLFDFPKLTEFLIRLLGVSCGPNALFLDCTAGSGTTAHAVLALNQQDGGDRRFILVQQRYDSNEHENTNRNICEQVTARRVSNAIKGYSYRKPKRGGGSERVEVAPLTGSFTYARLGKPLLGEYKDFGDELPSYEDLAKYVFYTETSREFPGANKRRNRAWDKRAGRIGEHAGRSYYLLYEPTEDRDRGLNRAFLADVASRDPNPELVVYCERLAVHQDELRKFCHDHGKRIRHMLVPFQLK